MLGYGIGYIGQGSSYNFMSAYFVVFLTNCVGLGSGTAASITSIALLVEVVTGMVVGNLSDHCTSSMGKRRPFILAASFAMPVVLLLIMRTVSASDTIKAVYYLVMSICFRISFSTFEIPNSAFGAEIAAGYDERTRLRTLTRIFSIIGNALGYVMPLLILDLFPEDQAAGWQAIGVILAVVNFGSWMGAFRMTRKFAVTCEEPTCGKKPNVIKDILVNYLELCRLRAMRHLVVYKAAFACAFALFNIGTIYYMKYSLGLDNRYSSYMYALSIAIFAVTTPVANRMAIRFGKARQQMMVMVFAAAVGFGVMLLGPRTVTGGALYMIGFSVMQTSFWQLSSSIFYDVVEVDEYVNYKRREGDIMSLVSVLGTLITAVIVQLFGILLEWSGFDAALDMQPDRVVTFLNCAYILAPCVCFVIGFVALKVFPINKKTFGSLVEALRLRRAGEDYSAYLEDVEKVL